MQNKKISLLFIISIFIYCYWLTNIKYHCKFVTEVLFCQWNIVSLIKLLQDNTVYLLSGMICALFLLNVRKIFFCHICRSLQINMLEKYQSLPVEAWIKENDNISTIFLYSIKATPSMLNSSICSLIIILIGVFLMFQISDMTFFYKKYSNNSNDYKCLFNFVKSYEIHSQLNLFYLVISTLLVIIGKLLFHLSFKIVFLKKKLEIEENSALAKTEILLQHYKNEDIKKNVRQLISSNENRNFLQRLTNVIAGISNISVFILINNSLFILKKLGAPVEILETDLLHRIAQFILSIIVCNFVFPYINEIKISSFVQHNEMNFLIKKYPSKEKIYENPNDGDILIQTKKLSDIFSIFNYISLHIKQGNKVAIVGKDQKVRLLYLIMGWTNQKEGIVLYNNIPTDQIRNIQFQFIKKPVPFSKNIPIIADDILLYSNKKKELLSEISNLNQTIIMSDSTGKFAPYADKVIFVDDIVYVDSHENLLQYNEKYKYFFENI